MKPFPSQTSVLVVGAGPAGLSAALALSRAGVDAVLIDARERIGHPMRCGEMVFPYYFSVLGLEPRRQWLRWNLPKARMVVLNRPRMEFELSEIIASRGVGVYSGTPLVGLGPFDGKGRCAKVLWKGKKREIYAGCVIAADGTASVTARLAGLDARLPPGRVASCVVQILSGAKPAMEDSYFVQPVAPFYFWVIPNGFGRLNVGLGVMGTEAGRARFLLSRLAAATKAFSGGKVKETFCALMPARRPMAPLVHDGLMVTGNAGRLMDKGGSGILSAALSGRAAAETIIGLNGADPTATALEGYVQRIDPLLKRLEALWDLMETGQAPSPPILGMERGQLPPQYLEIGP
ncbi:MAG: NAD(P)/FAD-dependent oxidoreductase [Deltaproteobacteria bacterium]|nr:NAD(P)/FAD-dependent oxidoreductase [Deltaproteobacteria bacterium]